MISHSCYISNLPVPCQEDGVEPGSFRAIPCQNRHTDKRRMSWRRDECEEVDVIFRDIAI